MSPLTGLEINSKDNQQDFSLHGNCDAIHSYPRIGMVIAPIVGMIMLLIEVHGKIFELNFVLSILLSCLSLVLLTPLAIIGGLLGKIAMLAKASSFRAGLYGSITAIIVGIICSFGRFRQGQLVILLAGAAFSFFVCAGIVIIHRCLHNDRLHFKIEDGLSMMVGLFLYLSKFYIVSSIK